MSREIKFRCPHYHYNGGFSGFSFWGQECEDVFKSPSSWSGTYRKEHEQFTGLYDRNGVEIYEGDILDHWFFDVKSGDRSIVVFKNGRFCGKAIDRNAWTSEIPNKCEVIGNIHHNPELIKL